MDGKFKEAQTFTQSFCQKRIKLIIESADLKGTLIRVPFLHPLQFQLFMMRSGQLANRLSFGNFICQKTQVRTLTTGFKCQ